MSRILPIALLILTAAGSSVSAIEPDFDGCIFCETLVARVTPNGKMVELTCGADDGVVPGVIFDVFRGGGNYLGRVQVTWCGEDRSRASIVYFVEGKTIEPGDRTQ